MVILLGIALLTLGWLWYEGAYSSITLDPVSLSLGVISSGFSVLASPFVAIGNFLMYYVLLPLLLVIFVIAFFVLQYFLIRAYIWIGQNIMTYIPMISDIVDMHIFKETKLTNNSNSYQKPQNQENPNNN